jgi:hypothetical protein
MGQRSSADGEGAGLNAHFRRLSRRPAAAGKISALVAHELYRFDASAVLNLSALPPDKAANFVADYCDALLSLHLRARRPTVRALFVDEAAQVAPQKPLSAPMRAPSCRFGSCIPAAAQGIGLKMATQSSADQDKRTMKQAETIVALRMGAGLGA